MCLLHTGSGFGGVRKGYPTLLEKLAEDLRSPDVENLLICITGDLAHTADYKEFKAAEEFLIGLSSSIVHGKVRGTDAIYITPGNHDVNYTKADIGERWQQYTAFANGVNGTHVPDADPVGHVTLDDRTDDLGAVVLCLNSSVYVQKDTPNEKRGEIDIVQLKRVEDSLEALSKKRDINEAIRIALIHHHPVLIPALAEPGRGYDAVENSGPLLTLLRRYGFHLILHGHKHNPFVFSEDSESAWVKPSRPIVISAAGSVSSMSIPGDYKERSNCYNRITIKWHPAARQARVAVETRGLSVFHSSGMEDLPQNWKWKTLQETDRQFYAAECVPKPKIVGTKPFQPKDMKRSESARVKEYSRSRGNMAVVEVLPSLVKGQAYEARAWIVPHPNVEFPRELPVRVTWSAGKMYPTVTVEAKQDEHFCVSFHYWDSMLLQARLEFKSKAPKSVCIHVYARLPEDCSSQ
jgi:3',5'-cyclic AMP phosphodiesterase CpdA